MIRKGWLVLLLLINCSLVILFFIAKGIFYIKFRTFDATTIEALHWKLVFDIVNIFMQGLWGALTNLVIMDYIFSKKVETEVPKMDFETEIKTN